MMNELGCHDRFGSIAYLGESGPKPSWWSGNSDFPRDLGIVYSEAIAERRLLVVELLAMGEARLNTILSQHALALSNSASRAANTRVTVLYDNLVARSRRFRREFGPLLDTIAVDGYLAVSVCAEEKCALNDSPAHRRVTRVGNIRNYPDGKLPPDAIYVGRAARWAGRWLAASPFGNPHRMSHGGKNRDEVCDAYVRDLRADPALVARIRRELAGALLLCWDHPLRCHADDLARIADGQDP